MTQGTKEILRRVEHWPQEDQDELAEELQSGVASDDEVAAFWQRHGLG